jgi:transcriptional regulator with XRE-family HTH domain
MNKRARAAADAARRAALDAALDREIEAATMVMRVRGSNVSAFDAEVDAPAIVLSAARARRLRSLMGAAHTRSETLHSPTPLAPSRRAEVSDLTERSFGPLVRAAREGRGMSVLDVALRLHVHRDYLTGLETGVRSPLALGPDGARRLVGMLGLSPHVAALALESSMRAALVPVAGFTARMKRGVPRKERLRLLAAAAPDEPTADQLRAWRELIDAVESLAP